MPYNEVERPIVTLVPHTTSLRGSRFEVGVPLRSLKAGSFDAQSLVTVPSVKLIRYLGALSAEHFSQVQAAVIAWLGLEPQTETNA